MPDITKGHTFADGEEVTHTKLNNIVDNAALNDGVVGASELASSAVTSVKIADDAVTAAKLADTTVAAAAYTTADITVDGQGRITAASTGVPADGSITEAMLVSGLGVVPAGAIIQFGAAAAPTGWLLCDGTATLNTYTYRVLHAVISNTYGGTAYSEGVTDQSGESTVFSVPDFKGRVAAGVDSSAGRITSDNTLGASSGAETHLLTGAESGTSEHTHALPNVWKYPGGSSLAGSGSSGSSSITSASDEADASSAHNNLQPYLVVQYIIKT